jgi:hypothetical protein
VVPQCGGGAGETDPTGPPREATTTTTNAPPFSATSAAADWTQAREYTFDFPAGATTLAVTIPKSDWLNTPLYFSPIIVSYRWDAGTHGQVTSIDW